jgi:hypothetical protein
MNDIDDKKQTKYIESVKSFRPLRERKQASLSNEIAEPLRHSAHRRTSVKN